MPLNNMRGPAPALRPTESKLGNLGETMRRAHRFWNSAEAGKAELACRQVLAVAPQHPDALHLLGLIAHAHGRLEQAVGLLRLACQTPGVPAPYLSNLAEMCRQRGLFDEGETAARRAIKEDPSYAGAWNNLGIILQESGRLEESRTTLENTLALAPEYAEAHNNLGNTFVRLGDITAAETHFRRALTINALYAEAHANYAALLNEQCRHADAAEHAALATRLKPRLADGYINLAAAESARHRYGEALRVLNVLLAIAPEQAAALSARANALRQLDRFDEALESARSAVAASPESGEAYNTLGTIQQAMGMDQPALLAFERAAAQHGPAGEKAMINSAVLFMERGQTTKAREAFGRALDAYPKSAAVWFNRADITPFRPGDPGIAAMESLLFSAPPRSQLDQMLLHFALGKAYLDIGDSDRAFGHLKAGNRTKRQTIAYDSEATSRWMGKIAEVFSPALMTRLEGQGARSDMPVFIVGMPRSGTTLLEQILASHPLVHGAGELRVVQRLVDTLGSFPQAVPTLDGGRLTALGNAYLSHIEGLADGRRHVVDKMPGNFLFVGLIRLMLPDARIIHCRRDPADTCLSCYSKLFSSEQPFAYDLGELGRFHRDYHGLMAHWRALLPASHFIEVDYEAVVDDTEAETRRILEFLGLQWDDACREFHSTQRTVRTASVNQVRNPVYRTSAGRWRRHAHNLGPLLATLQAPGG